MLGYQFERSFFSIIFSFKAIDIFRHFIGYSPLVLDSFFLFSFISKYFTNFLELFPLNRWLFFFELFINHIFAHFSNCPLFLSSKLFYYSWKIYLYSLSLLKFVMASFMIKLMVCFKNFSSCFRRVYVYILYLIYRHICISNYMYIDICAYYNQCTHMYIITYTLYYVYIIVYTYILILLGRIFHSCLLGSLHWTDSWM